MYNTPSYSSLQSSQLAAVVARQRCWLMIYLWGDTTSFFLGDLKLTVFVETCLGRPSKSFGSNIMFVGTS